MSGARRGRKAVGALVAVAVVTALGAVGLWLVKGFGLGPSHSQSETVSFDEPVSKLVLDGDAGDVSVVAEGDAVEITKTLRWSGEQKPTTKEGLSGDTLTVAEHGCEGIELLGPDNCRVEYDITLPADVALDLATDSGNIGTSGFSADQAIALDSGNVEISDATGNLKVDSDSGKIEGKELGGARSEISNDSGNVALEYSEAPERVAIANDSGNLYVTVPDDGERYRVDARVSSGNKDVSVPESADSSRDITASTDSGNIAVAAG